MFVSQPRFLSFCFKAHTIEPLLVVDEVVIARQGSRIMTTLDSCAILLFSGKYLPDIYSNKLQYLSDKKLAFLIQFLLTFEHRGKT